MSLTFISIILTFCLLFTKHANMHNRTKTQIKLLRKDIFLQHLIKRLKSGLVTNWRHFAISFKYKIHSMNFNLYISTSWKREGNSPNQSGSRRDIYFCHWIYVGHGFVSLYRFLWSFCIIFFNFTWSTKEAVLNIQPMKYNS